MLQPLIDTGALPHLSGLLGRGARGDLLTLLPQLPPLLWTSLASGQRADQHGVSNILLPDSRQRLQPLTRLHRQCPALWNQPECRSLVVNWPVTFPAEPLNGVCVSDVFFRLGGTAEALETSPQGSVFPPQLAEKLQELRFSPAGFTAAELEFFAADPEAALADSDPLLPRLMVALAESITVQAVATELLASESWDLAMLRFDLLGALGPEFFACLPPQPDYVHPTVFARYRNTIPAACRYLDLMLGVLMEQAGAGTTVVLVSERGTHSDHSRPADPRVALGRRGGEPWYRKHGLVAMAGPGVRPESQIQGASLLDIAPTILQLLQRPAGAAFPGRILREALTDPVPVGGPAPATWMPPQTGALEPRQREVALQYWRELDFLADDDIESPETANRHRRQIDFNRAMVALEARRSAIALPILERLHSEDPADDRVALHLARCRRQRGDLAGARELLEGVVAHPDNRPLELLQLGRLYLAEGEHDKALQCLFRAEQTQGDRPAVHAGIGEVYLAMQRWDEADRAFGKALERDDSHAASWRGLSATRLGQLRQEDAVASALRAVELDRGNLQGHYLLAHALAGSGRLAMAQQVFETCLELDPEHAGAHRGLAETCEVLGDTERATVHRRQAQQLASAAALNRQVRDLVL